MFGALWVLFVFDWSFKEVKLNLVGFMLAGYDTTSNTLSYCMHILTTHPEELAKLQDEIDAKFADPDVITN